MKKLCTKFFVIGVDEYLELENDSNALLLNSPASPLFEDPQNSASSSTIFNSDLFSLEFKARVLDQYPYEKSVKDDPSVGLAMPLVR